MTSPASAAAPAPVITPMPMDDHVFEALPDRIRHHAATRPDAPALREGDRIATWAEAADLIARAAGLLARTGVAPESAICILGDAHLEYALAYMAGLTAGACVAPLPMTMADETLARMIADSGAPVLIVSRSQKARAEAILKTPGLTHVRGLGLDFEAEGWPRLIDAALPLPAAEDLPRIQPDWRFNIIYSSGTTGVPKGIVHTNLFRSRQRPRFASVGVDGETRTLVTTSMYSNATLVALLATLYEGGCTTFMRKFDARTWFDIVESQRITFTLSVPVLLQRLLKQPEFDARDLSSLQLTICTSSPLPPAVKQDILRRWPGRFYELYGLTEGAVGAMLDLKAFPEKAASVGKPSAAAELMVIDDDGQPLPQGEVGEVIGRGPTMMSGYNGRPDLTEKALIRLADGRLCFRSGDLGWIDEDGFLFIVGRKKDMIISGGFNIYATDLEEALHAHADVVEVGVVGKPDDDWGETPVAGVILRAGATADPDEILATANSRLGRIQRITALHVVETLPRNTLGKVLKPDLLARLKDRTPEAKA